MATDLGRDLDIGTPPKDIGYVSVREDIAIGVALGEVTNRLDVMALNVDKTLMATELILGEEVEPHE